MSANAPPGDDFPSSTFPLAGDDLEVNLIDLLGSLSGAMDLVSPAVVDHHKRVAYIAARLGAQLGLGPAEEGDLLLAGLVHDIGAFHETVPTRLDTLRFETEQVFHSEVGYKLLLKFPGFSRIARMVRWHHGKFSEYAGIAESREELGLAGIIHLADRVDAASRRGQDTAAQIPGIVERIIGQTGRMFDPDHVEALRSLAGATEIWRDLDSPELFRILRGIGAPAGRALGLEELAAFTALFSQVIDFRSRFTSTHSRGVAATAVVLCRGAGFEERECALMAVAGDLHDLGKLAVPREILEKPGPLTAGEFARVREHPRHTHAILGQTPGMEQIRATAAAHHERLDGRGYPFHLGRRELDLGARIMAVADVFTAITEDRPYRAGMGRAESLVVLQDMARDGSLDPGVVGLLAEDFDAVNGLRQEAQAKVLAEFERFAREDAPDEFSFPGPARA